MTAKPKAWVARHANPHDNGFVRIYTGGARPKTKWGGYYSRGPLSAEMREMSLSFWLAMGGAPIEPGECLRIVAIFTERTKKKVKL